MATLSHYRRRQSRLVETACGRRHQGFSLVLKAANSDWKLRTQDSGENGNRVRASLSIEWCGVLMVSLSVAKADVESSEMKRYNSASKNRWANDICRRVM
jgi:hypothetical protein